MVWRAGTPHRRGRPAGTPGERVRLDVVLDGLEFDELAAALGIASPTVILGGAPFTVTPYNARARTAMASAWPWFATIAVLCALGPTLGPFLETTRAGRLAMAPIAVLIVCTGLVATIVGYGGSARSLRLLISQDQIAVVGLRSGQVLAVAPAAKVRAERFHFALWGRGDRLTNPGFTLLFPNGYSLSLPYLSLAVRRWPDHVPRASAPRFMTDPAAVQALERLGLFGVRADRA